MKNLLLLFLCLQFLYGTAQTDAQNLQKYWKFRNDLRDKYVKIGAGQGTSLVAGSRIPKSCADNTTADGTPVNETVYGTMWWGDGTIKHGHYLGLLASEYRLLKNSGADVSGVLNELYYGLEAINRLDRNAESELADIYDVFLSQNLNGFYMREDIEEDFGIANWNNESFRAGCTNSAYYINSTKGKVNSPSVGLITKGNSHLNSPSLDQMTSLMVGFSLIHKLVDNEYVKPTAQDPGFYIIDELKNIVDRIVRYAADHNWFVIDVHGWPAANGGGDLAAAALPLTLAANRITGKSYNNTFIRKATAYVKFQTCITGKGPRDDEQNFANQVEACFEIEDLGILGQITYNALKDGADYGPNNNQNNSVFQDWQKKGSLGGDINFARSFWENELQNTFPGLYSTLDEYPYPANEIYLDKAHLTEYNNTLIFNLGVMSGLWNQNGVSKWANVTENRQLELINGLLHDHQPTKPASFFKAYLDGQTLAGSYNMVYYDYYAPFGSTDYAKPMQKSAANGWASEYRWTEPTISHNPERSGNGIYNNIDYLLFHNLYLLAFPNENVEFKPTFDCFCSPDLNFVSNETYTQTARDEFDGLLDYIETCTPNALAPTFSLVSADFTLEPHFSSYSDLGIFTTDYQTEDAVVSSTGNLKIRNRFAICNAKTLEVEPQGKITIEKGEMFINVNARLDVSGEVFVRAGTTLTISNQAKMTIRPGGRLVLESGAKLVIDYGGELEYYNGAAIVTFGSENEIVLRGSLRLRNGGTFKVLNPSKPNGMSGRLIVEGTPGLWANEGGNFLLEGANKTDEYLVIKDNAYFWVYDPNISSFTVKDCKMTLGKASRMKSERSFYTENATISASENNGGMQLLDRSYFLHTDFYDVRIHAPLNIKNTGTFVLDECQYYDTENADGNLDSENILVEGMGYTVRNSTFYGGHKYMLSSKNLVYPSSVINSTFTPFDIVNEANTIGIYDVSDVELFVSGSHFSHLYSGVYKLYGQLSLRCNQFEYNYLHSNVYIANGLLNMSTSQLAGYNTMSNQGAPNILLKNANLNMNKGYNLLLNNSFTIAGSIYDKCPFPYNNCSISLPNNQWNLGNKKPELLDFNIVSGNDYYVEVKPLPLHKKESCGALDDGPKPADPIKIPNGGLVDVPGLIVQSGGKTGVSVNEAFEMALLKMELHNPDGNNMEALGILNAIFRTELDHKNEHMKPLIEKSRLAMKTTLEDAFHKGELTREANKDKFEEQVENYVYALNVSSEPGIQKENYVSQFYLELDKAHLFRLLDKSVKSIEILTQLEQCGLNAREQIQVNYWKRQYATDLKIKALGVAYLDTVIVIDTANWIIPAKQDQAPFYFGSTIHSVNEIEYASCGVNNKALVTSNQKSIDEHTIHPNPTQDQINVSWNTNQTLRMEIRDLAGKIVFSKVIANRENVDLSHYQRGIYLYKLFDDSELLYHGKIIRL